MQLVVKLICYQWLVGRSLKCHEITERVKLRFQTSSGLSKDY